MTTFRDKGGEPVVRLRLPGVTSEELMHSHDTIPCPETRGEPCKCRGQLRGQYGELPEEPI